MQETALPVTLTGKAFATEGPNLGVALLRANDGPLAESGLFDVSTVKRRWIVPPPLEAPSMARSKKQELDP